MVDSDPDPSRAAEGSTIATGFGLARSVLHFVVAWLVSLVTAVSLFASMVAAVTVDPAAGLTFRSALLSCGLTVGSHATGAFVLGTLVGDRIRPWRASVIFILPTVLLRAASFSWAFNSGVGAEEMLSQPGNLIIMPLVMLGVALYSSCWFVALGQSNAPRFSRANALLNIPWYQAAWALPLTLVQVVGVPVFVLLTLWKVDLLSDVGLGWSWFFDLPALLVRIPVLLLLLLSLVSIGSFYSVISAQKDRTIAGAITVGAANWLLLTGMEVLVVLVALGRMQGLA